MNGSEEILESYLLHELLAFGLIEFDSGNYTFRGDRNDYLVEIRLLNLGPHEAKARLVEH